MMKKISFYIGFFAAGIMLFSACTKDNSMKAAYVSADGTNAYIRFIHVAPSFRQVYNQADSFNIFMNGSKVNGAFLTYASLYPSAASNSVFEYVSVPAGAQTIKLSVAGVLSTDSVAIASFSNTLNAGTWNTMLITDSARIVLDDSYTKPASGSAAIRFVNVVMNDTAGKAVDIYSARAGANIFTNIKPGATPTAFANTTNVAILDTLYVRRAGTNITLAQLNGQTYINQRAYTLYYRGNGNLNTGTKARTLSIYSHN